MRKQLPIYLPLLFLTGGLLFIGLALILSASQVSGKALTDIFGRQLLWAAIGFVVLAICCRVDFHFWVRQTVLLYPLLLIMLAGVLFWGSGRYEAQRWFRLGTFYFQPSEFAKLIYIFTLAAYFEWRKRYVKRFSTTLSGFLLVLLPPAMLILLQPSLGTAFILIPIFFIMAYLAGAARKHLGALLLLGFACMPIFWLFLKEYQKSRILVFLNPGGDPLGAGYNIIQSRIAIGSGGLLGKGFLRGTQTHLAFLPEHHTDFIFSVLAEEWGFLGSVIFLILYYFFLNEIMKIAASTRDYAGTLIATGCAAMFSTHLLINIAMTMGFLPVVGIPLPFISYGGSSLIVSMAAVGVLLNIKRQERFL